ncbi:M23 family metallopeptidase [Fibrella sp. HMF5036]|uniref:M23 family metallopeptidase n=1 Tax=Fibrella aquatilis TaxID=2817059 RepID=A0A939G6F4_9BACT|nr:M23 family metallopeptidase [Fibrella aquatilis]
MQAVSSDEAVRLFDTLFWLSPELAQSIPCLPPLGDWSGNRISSGFGWRSHPTLRTIRHHDGIDIAGPHQYVRAAANGVVVAIGKSASLGQYIRVNHLNSYTTLYGHLAMTLVRAGQRVHIGETLGITGRTGRATGVHLHYSVLKQDVPVDPARYLTLAIEFVNTYQRHLNRITNYQPTNTALPVWQK